MQQAQQRDNPELLDGRGLRIAIVQARFNVDITDALVERCVQQLHELGVEDEDIDLISVPGALEIPQALGLLADAGQHHALIALGCVVRGGTYHFELVCDTSAVGVQQVALDYGVMIANGILTVEDLPQAEERLNKGAECARVAVEMANWQQLLQAEEEEQ